MKWFRDESEEVPGRRYPVRYAADGNTAAVNVLPSAKETYPPSAFEPSVDHLWEEVQIRDQGWLEYDTDIRGVEELDGILILVAPVPVVGQL